MSVKIAINGFGRIGRCSLRKIIEDKMNIEVVAINDLSDIKTIAHLLKYDSTYGTFNGAVEIDGNNIIVDGKKISVLCEKDPEKLPWKDLKVDVVLECTGAFRDKESNQKHINSGAKKVIISAPAKDDDIPSYILGVNDDKYKGEEIIDMGSCTTNCLAPVVKILEEEFGIIKGFMTTIHSYTNDQVLLDIAHKDLRRARTAGENIIPTTTGAAKAIGKVVFSVQGKLDGIAVRVPTSIVSLIDLVCELNKETTTEEINQVFEKRADKKELKRIIRIEKAPLVSSDFIKDSYSSIFDPEYTKVKGNMIKVMAWYDNEWAYSCRLVELAEKIGK